jgi:hypothetical protein
MFKTESAPRTWQMCPPDFFKKSARPVRVSAQTQFALLGFSWLLVLFAILFFWWIPLLSL